MDKYKARFFEINAAQSSDVRGYVREELYDAGFSNLALEKAVKDFVDNYKALTNDENEVLTAQWRGIEVDDDCVSVTVRTTAGDRCYMVSVNLV